MAGPVANNEAAPGDQGVFMAERRKQQAAVLAAQAELLETVRGSL